MVDLIGCPSLVAAVALRRFCVRSVRDKSEAEEGARVPTIQQLVRQGRTTKFTKTKTPALKGSPQRRGVCTRVYTNTPKKPNSASARSPACACRPGVEITAVHPW
jgi:small subunit ribosomal protein S12